jgi:dihydrodipicolinate synthase/N-acetylneuraminate lyase
MPPNTSIDISIELCVDLASHPNIIGMKDSGGDVSIMRIKPKISIIFNNFVIRYQNWALLSTN